MTDFNNIKFDTLNFNRSNLIIADLDVFKVWGLADKPALFIGMNFLQLMSSFTIDYRRKELHFKLAEYERLPPAAPGSTQTKRAAPSGAASFAFLFLNEA